MMPPLIYSSDPTPPTARFSPSKMPPSLPVKSFANALAQAHSGQSAGPSPNATIQSTTGNSNVFFGYNGVAYTRDLPDTDSFLASNGKTYSKDEVVTFYSQNPSLDVELKKMAELGLKPPDIYKARALAGRGDGVGIYSDPKEALAYSAYFFSKPKSEQSNTSFTQWRDQQSQEYLANLQLQATENIGWLGGPEGGVEVGSGSTGTWTT